MEAALRQPYIVLYCGYPSALHCGVVCVCVQYGGILVHCIVVLCVCAVWWYLSALCCGVVCVCVCSMVVS